MTTTDLTSSQWLMTCAAIGSAILWIGELVKIGLRARANHTGSR
jgi:P-type Ca2+ transporter type 2C